MNKNLIYSINQKGIAMDYTYFQNDKGNFVAKKLPTAKGKFITIKDESYLEELREELKEFKPKTLAQFTKVYRDCFGESGGYDVELLTFEEAVEENKKNWLGDKKWISTHWEGLIDVIPELECGNVEVNENWQLIPDYDAEELIETGMFVISRELSGEQWKFAFKGNRLPELKELANQLNLDPSLQKEQLIDQLAKIAIDDPLKIDDELVRIQLLVKPKPELKEALKWVVEQYINDIKQALTSFDYPKQFQVDVWEYVEIGEEKTYLNQLIHAELLKQGAKVKRLKEVSNISYNENFLQFSYAVKTNKGDWLGDKKWISVYWEELKALIESLGSGNIEVSNDWQLTCDIEADELINTGMFNGIRELSAEQWRVVFNKNRATELKALAKELGLNSKLKKELLVNELMDIALNEPEKINHKTIKMQFLVQAKPEVKEALQWLVEQYIKNIKLALNAVEYSKFSKREVWEYLEIGIKDTYLRKLIRAELSKLDYKKGTQQQAKNVNVFDFTTKSKDISMPATFKVRFSYEDGKGNKSLRLVDVRKLNDEDSLMFTGYCHKAEDDRTFRVDRISSDIIFITTNGEETLNKNEFTKFLKSTAKAVVSPERRIVKPATKQTIKSNVNRVEQNQQATGCLVVSVALIGTLLAVPISVVNIFI